MSDDADITRLASWSGSEDERKPQGTVLPPSREPVVKPHFFVPVGTFCRISKVVSGLVWFPYTTKKPVGFERYEEWKLGHMVFREGGYLIRVSQKKVVFRNPEDMHRLPRL